MDSSAGTSTDPIIPNQEIHCAIIELNEVELIVRKTVSSNFIKKKKMKLIKYNKFWNKRIGFENNFNFDYFFFSKI
jgi:hypothetical protein